MKVTLLIPTLNELEGMKVIMPQVRREWYDELIVLDGGSTDGTVEWARTQGYRVVTQSKPGLRSAYSELWPHLTTETVITFSPDGNCLPELIPQIATRLREGYDMVIASRYLDGAVSEDDDLLTSFGNWLFTTSARWMFGGSMTDVMGIYRGYRCKLIAELNLDQDDAYALAEMLFFTKISWEPLLSARALKYHKRISEIPGDEPARIAGERKLQVLRWGAAYYFQFLREWLFLK